ncbi:MAG: 3'-5' exonuclease [Epsilonproteobacteria bacterium]|nr:3'-5' exonuclease [Campylobacterota bacterium]
MKIIILDTETTGNKKEDRICQLSYLVLDENLNIEEINSRLVKPPIPIKYEAMAVHHITNEMIQNKPKVKFTQEYKRLKELNDPNNLLVIHNSEFDLEMLKKEDFNSHFKLIDTFRVLKHLMPDWKYSLQYNRYALGLYKKEKELCTKYNIKITPHDALGDVVVLKLLFEYLIKEQKHSFEELIELTKKPIIHEKFYMGKYKHQKIKEIIIKDPDYIEFLLTSTDIEPDVKYSIEHYLQNLEQPMEFRFKGGKYKNMLVEDVAAIDMGYLSWAYHNMKMGKWMRKRIGEIINNS